ncbi:hypothetical protein As57867_022631, partial [Aphanomyces stellatus]
PLTSYSVGGATTSDAILQGWLGGKFGEPLRADGSTIKVPGLDTQIANYVTCDEPTDKTNILYTMWVGGNDDSDNAMLGLGRKGDEFADAQMVQWETLVRAGAKNILAVVPPPMTLFAIEYGTKMHVNAAAFRLKHWSVKLGLFETPIVMGAIVATPKLFGFKYTTNERCCTGNCFSGLAGNATVCNNPDEYALWDVVGHPSAHTHQILGDEATKLIKLWF